MSTLDQEFAAENSELCIKIAQRDKELAKLRDLLARLLCWPVWHELKDGPTWIAVIAETLKESATLSESSNEVKP